MTNTGPVLTTDDVVDYLKEVFPQVFEMEDTVVVEAVGHNTARVRQIIDRRHLRPGGTISGPTMFRLADLALYVAILAQIGKVGLAVTTNLNINFLRKPSEQDLIAECRLFKVGARLAVGEVLIYSEGTEDPVAHATGTYSIPPGSKR
ncbi:MAG: PaaI family thioesterase [Rhodobiaceae bacterium]|nr:PaaI family thioesterase [Rhodobiaceae bacterium]